MSINLFYEKVYQHILQMRKNCVIFIKHRFFLSVFSMRN